MAAQPKVEVQMSVSGLSAVQQAFQSLLAESKRFTEQDIVNIQAQARMQHLIQTEHRVTWQGVKEGITVLRDFGSIGTQVLGMWTAWNVSQIRCRDALQDVETAQRKYNQEVAENGKYSEQATQASERLRDAQERLKQAQDQNIAGYIGMAFQTVGLIGTTVQLIEHISRLKKGLDLATISAYALNTALAGIGAGAGFLAAGAIWEATAKPLAKALGEPEPPGWLEALQKVFENVFSGEAFRWWWEQIQKLFGGAPSKPFPPPELGEIPGFQKGGIIPREGIYYLHPGELVVPKEAFEHSTSYHQGGIGLTPLGREASRLTRVEVSVRGEETDELTRVMEQIVARKIDEFLMRLRAEGYVL